MRLQIKKSNKEIFAFNKNWSKGKTDYTEGSPFHTHSISLLWHNPTPIDYNISLMVTTSEGKLNLKAAILQKCKDLLNSMSKIIRAGNLLMDIFLGWTYPEYRLDLLLVERMKQQYLKESQISHPWGGEVTILLLAKSVSWPFPWCASRSIIITL